MKKDKQRSTKHTYKKWETFEDTKGVIGSLISKERQYNGQKKKNNRTKLNTEN